MTRSIVFTLLLSAKILFSSLLQCDFVEPKAATNTGNDTLRVLKLSGALYKGTAALLYDIKNIESDSRKIAITINGKLKQTIELPTQNEYNGFAVNSLKAAGEGFALSVEYGSRIYYTKVFYFTYKNNFFYLNKISTISFDKERPLDEKRYIKKIDLQRAVRIFPLSNYLND